MKEQTGCGERKHVMGIDGGMFYCGTSLHRKNQIMTTYLCDACRARQWATAPGEDTARAASALKAEAYAVQATAIEEQGI